MARKDPQLLLGNVIRSERTRLNLSQEDFAEVCGLHRTYVGAIERGERNISLHNIIRIAKALKLKAAVLLDKAGL